MAHREPAPVPPSPPQATERLKAAVATLVRAKGAGGPSTPGFDPAPEPAQVPSAAAGQSSSAPSEPYSPPPATAESSLEELLFAVYLTQQQIVELLRPHLGRGLITPEPPGRERKDAVEGEGFMAFLPAPARARKRKSVLLVDDDEATLRGAVAALEKADVPVRTATNGNEALAALSEETPDVIALEAELSGDPGGADLIQRVRATMEWITIPIVLYTRARVQSQQEARAVYGADAFVLKGPLGPAALVSQVITVFRSVQ